MPAPIFGHLEAHVIEERTERSTEGLATQAMVAVENARLSYQAQQELEARRQAEADKEAFLEALAHDLANPLTALKAQAQVLRRRVGQGRADTATLETGLAAIDAAADRATRLIAELTDTARLEAQRSLELHRTPTDLVSLAQRIVTEFRAAAGHRLQLNSVQPELIGSWDADRLARVLENLLANAIKYSSDTGMINIRIDRAEASDGAYAILSIADQGMGIPANDLPHIFERFRRGGNVAGRFVGTGLGLWGSQGSQRIVAQHGGTIAIASAEDQGTTVTVRLPLTVVAEPSDAPQVRHHDSPRSHRSLPGPLSKQSDFVGQEHTMAAPGSKGRTVTYDRIVVPLDGSELAEEAIAHAETLARATGAPIHVVRVVDTPPLTQVAMVGLGVEQAAQAAALRRIEAEEAAAAEYLEVIRERLVARGLVTTTAVVTGDVVPELLGAVRPRDVLVMTTHGRTGLTRWFLGSVAEAVVRRSPAPVLLVRSVAVLAKAARLRAARP
jgi:signal transduction histidine kinase/nucleotide-binding universal stress UspA family protein